MEPFGLPESSQYDTAVFSQSAVSTIIGGYQTWTKPFGKSMATIIAVGGGGAGGKGAIGVNSAAAGGGGGGSGSMVIVDIPLAFLPPILYVQVSPIRKPNGTRIHTIVATAPFSNSTKLNTIAHAPAGGNGTDASAGTAGSGGGGFMTAQSDMPTGWPFMRSALFAKNGSQGSSGPSNPIQVIGLNAQGTRMNGGSGGGGLGAAGAVGESGGDVVAAAGTALSNYFNSIPGGSGGTSPTDPAGEGMHGHALTDLGSFYFLPGSGSSSTHGSATGAGLAQARGGNGGLGNGGGGSGGALTGSTPADGGDGGPGLVIITCY